MADDQDYAELSRLLSSPASWSDQEAEYMRSLLVSQTEAVAGCHPKDIKRRRSMQAVIDEVRTALEQHQASRG